MTSTVFISPGLRLYLKFPKIHIKYLKMSMHVIKIGLLKYIFKNQYCFSRWEEMIRCMPTVSTPTSLGYAQPDMLSSWEPHSSWFHPKISISFNKQFNFSTSLIKKKKDYTKTEIYTKMFCCTVKLNDSYISSTLKN